MLRPDTTVKPAVRTTAPSAARADVSDHGGLGPLRQGAQRRVRIARRPCLSWPWATCEPSATQGRSILSVVSGSMDAWHRNQRGTRHSSNARGPLGAYLALWIVTQSRCCQASITRSVGWSCCSPRTRRGRMLARSWRSFRVNSLPRSRSTTPSSSASCFVPRCFLGLLEAIRDLARRRVSHSLSCSCLSHFPGMGRHRWPIQMTPPLRSRLGKRLLIIYFPLPRSMSWRRRTWRATPNP